MTHPSETCAACRNLQLAEAFQRTAANYRGLLTNCATALCKMLDQHGDGKENVKPCTCAACSGARDVVVKLADNGITVPDYKDEPEPEMKRCRHCRKEYSVDDPYCRCDAEAGKAGE